MLEGANVPALAPDYPALHVFARDRDDRDGRFRNSFGRNALDRRGEDLPRFRRRILAHLFLDLPDEPVRIVAYLGFDLGHEDVFGFLRRQVGHALDLGDLLALKVLELLPRFVKRFLALGESAVAPVDALRFALEVLFFLEYALLEA